MKSYQFTTCERIEAPDQPDYDGQLVVISGLVTPIVAAESRGEALANLNQWFKDNMCRPHREVT